MKKLLLVLLVLLLVSCAEGIEPSVEKVTFKAEGIEVTDTSALLKPEDFGYDELIIYFDNIEEGNKELSVGDIIEATTEDAFTTSDPPQAGLIYKLIIINE